MKVYKDFEDFSKYAMNLLGQITNDRNKSAYTYHGPDLFGQDFLSIKDCFCEPENLERLKEQRSIHEIFIEKVFQMGFCVGQMREVEHSSAYSDLLESVSKSLKGKASIQKVINEQKMRKYH